jgi:hypothetical protein
MLNLPDDPYQICLHALVHAWRQKTPAYDPDTEICQYRFEGRKCVVGSFIPDILYADWMEETPANKLAAIIDQNVDTDSDYVTEYYELSRWLRKHEDLLQDLQEAHDKPAMNNSSDPVYDWAWNTMDVTTRHCQVNVEIVRKDAEALMEKLSNG